jgi:hypothetical protein
MVNHFGGKCQCDKCDCPVEDLMMNEICFACREQNIHRGSLKNECPTCEGRGYIVQPMTDVTTSQYKINEVVNEKGCKWSIGNYGLCGMPCRECHHHQRKEGFIFCPCCLEKYQ